MLQGWLMYHHTGIVIFNQHMFGNIIFCGAKAASKNNQIRKSECLINGAFYVITGIRNGRYLPYSDPN